jgi:hypothetical protein
MATGSHFDDVGHLNALLTDWFAGYNSDVNIPFSVGDPAGYRSEPPTISARPS